MRTDRANERWQTMAYVLIEHRVGDFETFRQVYLDDAERRARLGSQGGVVFRVADDPNNVIVMLAVGHGGARARVRRLPGARAGDGVVHQQRRHAARHRARGGHGVAALTRALAPGDAPRPLASGPHRLYHGGASSGVRSGRPHPVSAVMAGHCQARESAGSFELEQAMHATAPTTCVGGRAPWRLTAERLRSGASVHYRAKTARRRSARDGQGEHHGRRSSARRVPGLP